MERPDELQTLTPKIKTACGKCYITVSKPEEEYKEIFAMLGKAGGCAGAISQALTRCLTVAMNPDCTPEKLARQLIGIQCPNSSPHLPCCVEAIGLVLRKHFVRKGEPIDPDE
jgi:hypothetical protein